MAHYASKCVDCTDSHKKCIRTRMKDGDGKVFYGQFYECGNSYCDVKRGLSHGRRSHKAV